MSTPQCIITLGSGKRVDAQIGSFTIHTDQPVAGGGEGSAPAPYSLFMASIGTCAGFYVQSFCSSRGLSTDGIRIEQRWLSDEATHTLLSVELDIIVPPTFPEQYRAALVRVADQCTVKKAIAAQPKFNVQTVVSAHVAAGAAA